MNNALRFSLAAALAYATLSTAAAQTFREGIYTAAQATQGEQVYFQKCAVCHGENLSGIEMAPPLAGPNFKAVWESQPLLSLANRIQATMPPFAPNSLSNAEVVGIVSYMLKVNELPAGNAPLSIPLGDAPSATSTSSIRIRPLLGASSAPIMLK